MMNIQKYMRVAAAISDKPVIVPSNPEDLKKIKKELENISNEMTMIDARKELISDTIKGLSETYDLPVKFVRKMAVTYHKQTFDKQVDEMDEFDKLYTAVVGGG